MYSNNFKIHPQPCASKLQVKIKLSRRYKRFGNSSIIRPAIALDYQCADKKRQISHQMSKRRQYNQQTARNFMTAKYHGQTERNEIFLPNIVA